MAERYQPMQPVECDEKGVPRFRENKFVRLLLDQPNGLTLNDLVTLDYPKEDYYQLMQLIGYSVSAAPIPHDLIHSADMIVAETDLDNVNAGEMLATPEQARIRYLEKQLDDIRERLAIPIAELYNVHEEVLLEQRSWCS